MILPANVPRGVFYTLKEGWVLLNRDVPRGSELIVSKDLPIRCMFKVQELTFEATRVGFLFTSGFEVINRGGFLFTHLKNKPPATEYDTLIKDEFLVLYDYPNRGTLAISPLVSDDIQTIFEEQ